MDLSWLSTFVILEMRVWHKAVLDGSGMEDRLPLYWSGVCVATQEFSKEKQTLNTSKSQDSSRKEASEKHMEELTSNVFSAAESERWILVAIFQPIWLVLQNKSKWENVKETQNALQRNSWFCSPMNIVRWDKTFTYAGLRILSKWCASTYS